ncbi:MAG: CD225/dispanin family protein, partial [Bacteroidota bacterium]|nr:CD225/dispanin family protein [Bacteroidota bacterium]
METPLMSNDNFNQNVKPKSYLTESILVTIFCCLPFGIASIVNAANVESRWNAGDFVGSISASAAAKKWMKIGLFAGIA